MKPEVKVKSKVKMKVKINTKINKQSESESVKGSKRKLEAKFFNLSQSKSQSTELEVSDEGKRSRMIK